MSRPEYKPSLHAIDRAKQRLGVEPSQARRWFNEAMRKARYVVTQTVKGRTQMIYEYEGMRLVIDDKTIVTIKPSVDTSFLQPIFEREYRKLARLVTRKTRSLELDIAELTVQLGERLTAKARAKNPKTREQIQRQINIIQTQINDCDAMIRREQDKLTNFEKATKVYV